MKKYVLSLIACFSSLALIAQVSISFTPEPVDEWVEESGELVGHGFVTNDSDTEKTFLWQRIIDCNAGNYTTLVCDKNLCYIPQVSEMEFTLGPSTPDDDDTDVSNIDLHLQVNGSMEGALVRIKITEVGNEENTITGEFIYQSCTPASTTELEIASIHAFPNPTNGTFRLTENQFIDKVEIYNIVGQPMTVYRGNARQTYDISEFPTGMYLVRISNKEGDALKTIRINKI